MSFLTLLTVLEPRKQTSADLNIEKLIFALIHEIVEEYVSFFLFAINSARRLWYLVHSLLIPPVVEKTRGVKVPCSMSLTRSAYFRFFSSSCIL